MPIVIRVTVAQSDPLSGIAAAGPGDALQFEGWLELLNALAKLVAAGDHTVGSG